MRVDESLVRGKAELHDLVGDASKARERLGWAPTLDFEGLVHLLVDTRPRASPSGARADGRRRPADGGRRGKRPPPARSGRPPAAAGRGRRANAGLAPITRASSSRYDAAGWVLEYEARQLERIASSLGIRLGPGRLGRIGVAASPIFHLSQFTLLLRRLRAAREPPRRVVLPRSAGHARNARVRRMLRHAAAPARGHRPRPGDEPRDGGARARDGDRSRRRCTESRSGSTSTRFRSGRPTSTALAREAFDIPESAFVVGSFQKDGVGWGDGLEPKLIKGPDVLLAVARAAARARSRARRPADRACARVRQGRARAARHPVPARAPARHRLGRACVRRDRRLPRHLARRGRAARRARGDGDGRAARDDPRRTGRRPRPARGERLAGRRRGRRRRSCECDGARGRGAGRASSTRVRRAGRATAEENSYEALRPRWRDLLDGFVELPDRGGVTHGSERRTRRPLRRAGGALGDGCSSPGHGAAPGVRVFYGHDRVPAPGDAVSGGTAKIQRLAERFPNHPTDFSLLYLGSNWLPRDLGAAPPARPPAADPARRQPGRRRLPGVGGRRETEEREPPASQALLAAADHVLYQSEFCKRSADTCLGEPGGHVGGPPQRRRRRTASRPPSAPPAGGPGAAPRRRPDAGVPARARRCATLAALAAVASGRASCSSPGGSSAPVEPLVGELGLARPRAPARRVLAARCAGDLPPGAPPAAHEGERPVPERRARGDGGGLPVVYPLSGGTPSSSATRRGSACPIPTARSGTSPRPPRRSPPRSPRARGSAALRGCRAAARRRALRARALARASRRAVRAARADVAADAAAQRRERSSARAARSSRIAASARVRRPAARACGRATRGG